MSGGCPRVGNFSDQKWGVSVIAVIGSAFFIIRLNQRTNLMIHPKLPTNA